METKYAHETSATCAAEVGNVARRAPEISAVAQISRTAGFPSSLPTLRFVCCEGELTLPCLDFGGAREAEDDPRLAENLARTRTMQGSGSPETWFLDTLVCPQPWTPRLWEVERGHPPKFDGAVHRLKGKRLGRFRRLVHTRFHFLQVLPWVSLCFTVHSHRRVCMVSPIIFLPWRCAESLHAEYPVPGKKTLPGEIRVSLR